MKFLHTKHTDADRSNASLHSGNSHKLKAIFSREASTSSAAVPVADDSSSRVGRIPSRSSSVKKHKTSDIVLPDIASVKSRSRPKLARRESEPEEPVPLTGESFQGPLPPFVTKKIMTDTTTGDELSLAPTGTRTSHASVPMLKVNSNSSHAASSLNTENSGENTKSGEGFLNSILTALHSMRSHSDIHSMENSPDQGQTEQRKSLNEILETLRKSGASQQQTQQIISAIEQQQKMQQQNDVRDAYPTFTALKPSPVVTMGKGNLNLSFFDKGKPQRTDMLTGQQALDELAGTSTPKKNLSFIGVDNGRVSERALSPRARGIERNNSSDRRKNSRNPIPASVRLAMDANKSMDSGTTNTSTDPAEDHKLFKRSRNSFRSLKGPAMVVGNGTGTENGEEEATAIASPQQLPTSLAETDTAMPDEKHQAEFHQLFKNIPPNERLVGDFVCALRKKVLIQGKMYISENNVNFRSNLLGFVTNMTIPAGKIVQIVRKNTAGVFPNAIEIRTLHDTYGFASFVNRDPAFEMLTSVWDRALHGSERKNDTKFADYSDETDDEYDFTSDEESVTEGHNVLDSEDETDDERSSISDKSNMTKSDIGDTSETFNGIPLVGPKTHPPTDNGHVKESGEIEVADETVNAPLGVVANLFLGDDTSFVKNLLVAQKNFDISEIPAFGASKKRSYSYTKPLNGPIGPKQTVCKIEETIDKYDLNENVISTQMTATPDVPSGNSFKVKTRTYLSWAPQNKTRVYVVTMLVWSGRSLIKSAVEKGTISGQKEGMEITIRELRQRITSGGTTLKRNGSSKRKRSKTVSAPSPEVSRPVEDTQPAQQPGGKLDFFMSTTFLQVVVVVLLVYILFTRHTHSEPQRMPVADYEPRSVSFNSGNYLREKSEYDIWEWIESRNSNNGKRGAVPPPGTAAALRHSFDKRHANQELKDMINSLQQRLNALQLEVD